MSVDVDPAPSGIEPPAAPAHARIPITAIARDPFFWVRVAAITAYGIGYVWWFREKGLIVDRISVALSVAIFLACAFAGKPWRRWAVLLVDASLYAVMWFCYEMTRGAADRLGFPLQVEAPLNVDRALFLGIDPTVWLQRRLYHADDVRWYDNVASATYYTHFVFPVIALAVLWAASRVHWVRFMKRFATLLGVACAMFVVFPTAPPWMVARTKPVRIGDDVHRFGQLPPLARHTGRGFADLGFHSFVKGWQQALDWGNAVAAMPSLHSAFALFVPAFFLPWIRWRWLKALVLLFPVLMLTSLVYFGEHWVIDGFVGWAIVGGSFWFWNRMESRRRRARAGRARRRAGRGRRRRRCRASRSPIACVDRGGAVVSSPTAPTVLLDSPFLAAVARTDHPEHGRAAACYRDLLDRYEAGEVRLRARRDALAVFARDLFAPVERISVAAQHRRAAARLRLPVPVSADVAVTLVVMRREGIRRIATLDPTFDAFDLHLEVEPQPTRT